MQFYLSEFGSPPTILYFPDPLIYLQILYFFNVQPNKILLYLSTHSCYLFMFSKYFNHNLGIFTLT